MTSKDFFFCYSKQLADYLKQQGFSLITIGRNVNTNTIYSMFLKSESLNHAIDEYRELYWTDK